MRLIKKIIVKIFFLTIIFSCNSIEINPKLNNMNDTPFAKKIKVIHKEHYNNREDNYFWLKNRDENDVIDYLEKENGYYKKKTKNQKEFKKNLFEEMKSRIKKMTHRHLTFIMIIGIKLDMKKEMNTLFI